MEFGERFLRELVHELAGTRRTLERVPEERLGWSPHARSGTLGWLASHMAELPRWTATLLDSDGYDVTRGGGGTRELTAVSAILAAFDANAAAAHQRIAATPAGRFVEPWSLRRAGETIFTLPRGAVLDRFLLRHLVHHRGQLTVYLRLCGVPVPALYGPSADEEG